jgi:hypothetical protein
MTAKGVGINIKNQTTFFHAGCSLILYTQDIHNFFFNGEESIIE